MKKRILILALVLALTLPAGICPAEAPADSAPRVPRPGDRVEFGRYEQDADKGNGTEPIRWKVLDTDGEQALLISEFCLETMPYHDQKDDPVSWDNCSLRAWLNGEFFGTAFSPEEQAAILPTTADAAAEPAYRYIPGSDRISSPDPVFILSRAETEQYMDLLAQGYCDATAWAVSRGAELDSRFRTAEYWTRTTGYETTPYTVTYWDLEDLNYCFKLKRYMTNKQITVRPAIRIQWSLDMFQQALADSEKPVETVSWQGFDCSLMYWEVYGYDLLVRVACEDLPTALLYENRLRFELIPTEGPAFSSAEIRAMEGTVQENEDPDTVDFFDIVFHDTRIDEALTARYSLMFPDGTEAFPMPPRGSEALSRCVFETHDGVQVISLFTFPAAYDLGTLLAPVFEHRDVTLCLDGWDVSSGRSDSFGRIFLNRCDFGSLRLIMADRLRLTDLDQPESITELRIGDYAMISQELPRLEKLTFRLGESSPYLPYAENLPALKELTLILSSRWWDEDPFDVLGSVSRPEDYCYPSLERITVIAQDGSEFSTDPDLISWLENQPGQSGGLLLNGTPAAECDFAAGLEGEDAARLRALQDRFALAELFREYGAGQTCPQRDVTPEDLGQKILFAVCDRDRVRYTSLEDDPDFVTSDFPADRLASSLEEADTLIFIYPVYTKVGEYIWVKTGEKYYDALECDTCVAVVGYRDGEMTEIAFKTVYRDDPPGNLEFETYPRTNAGFFFHDRGYRYIREIIPEM